jgi:hypothetical protein
MLRADASDSERASGLLCRITEAKALGPELDRRAEEEDCPGIDKGNSEGEEDGEEEEEEEAAAAVSCEADDKVEGPQSPWRD